MTRGERTPFGALCQALYQRNRPYKSQPKFTLTFIEAAGASSAGISDDLATKFFRGERSLTVAFPDRFVRDRLIEFLRSCVEFPRTTDEERTNRCAAIARALESPIEQAIDRERFYRALAAYTDDVVHPDRKLAPFADYYTNDFQFTDNPDQPDLTPLHAGDHVTNFSDGRTDPLKLRTYECTSYVFMLMNDGNVDWNGRVLQCTNPDDDWLRPEQTDVAVPFTAPSRFRRIEIPLTLRAQHMEGETCSCWVMLDEHGNNCFPNNPDLFNIKATIAFVPEEEDAS